MHLTGPIFCATIAAPSKKVAAMQPNHLQHHLLSHPASARAESVRFGLLPRLTESWRGFYFYYFFAGQTDALHAWTEAAP